MEGEPTKRCPRCGEVKPLDAFDTRRGRYQRQSYCRPCIRAYQRGRPRVLAAKRLVRGLKTNKTCADCRLEWPHYVLDFDHLPGFKKLANINVLVKRGASEEVILAEVAKCDLICSNCHRIRTHWRKHGSNGQPEESLL